MIPPKLGDRAVYRPRVPYGRQHELFCFVTRVINAEGGIVDLVAFPAAGEFLHINNVARMTEAVQIHCWEPHTAEPGADASDLLSIIGDLEARVAVLESKRSRGKQSDDAKTDAEKASGEPEKVG